MESETMEFLKVKQFGLPRWIWLSAIGGGVAVGLYIRSKRAEAAAEGGTDPTTQDEGGAVEAGAMDYNGAEGLPVGYYDAVSGPGDYLPDAAGPDTTNQIDANGLISALLDLASGQEPAPDDTGGARIASQKRGKAGKKGARGKRGRPGKRGHGGHKPGKISGGGGPPKRPKPKVHHKHKKGGTATYFKPKKKHRRRRRGH